MLGEATATVTIINDDVAKPKPGTAFASLDLSGQLLNLEEPLRELLLVALGGSSACSCAQNAIAQSDRRMKAPGW